MKKKYQGVVTAMIPSPIQISKYKPLVSACVKKETERKTRLWSLECLVHVFQYLPPVWLLPYQHSISLSGKHYILFDTIENSAKLHRDLAERKYMAPLVTVSKADVPTINKWRKLLKLQVIKIWVPYFSEDMRLKIKIKKCIHTYFKFGQRVSYLRTFIISGKVVWYSPYHYPWLHTVSSLYSDHSSVRSYLLTYIYSHWSH